MDILQTLFDLFEKHGHEAYGERVTLKAHMLQSAVFAERDAAPASLIAAAVLHDIGHFLHDLGEDIADQGIDSLHEELGAKYLEPYFIPAVTEPIRLHVPAKRYLCAVDPAYLAALSPASAQSLALQGGVFSPEEVKAFEQTPFFAEAVRLRHYDDLGKEEAMETPPLTHFRPYLEAGLR
jgi:phosphonate degradation associated HDIG domain protein